MKRMLLVVSLFVSQLGNGHATGSYDGEWSGSATATNAGRCKRISVTLTVRDNEVIGKATSDLGVLGIRGTVAADGSLSATIGFRHLEGKFVDDRFTGSFDSFNCVWNMNLRRQRGVTSQGDVRTIRMNSLAVLAASTLAACTLGPGTSDSYSPVARVGVAPGGYSFVAGESVVR